MENYNRIAEENIKIGIKRKEEATKSINNILFVLGTGTLVVSITFIGSYKSEILSSWLLIASWIFIIISTGANLFANFLILKESSEYIGMQNFLIKSDVKLDNPEKEVQKRLRSTQGYMVNAYLTTVMFLYAGIMSLTVFGGINVGFVFK